MDPDANIKDTIAAIIAADRDREQELRNQYKEWIERGGFAADPPLLDQLTNMTRTQ